VNAYNLDVCLGLLKMTKLKTEASLTLMEAFSHKFLVVKLPTGSEKEFKRR